MVVPQVIVPYGAAAQNTGLLHKTLVIVNEFDFLRQQAENRRSRILHSSGDF